MSHRPRSRHLAGLDGTSTRAIEILALMETGPPSRDTGWLSELTQVFNAGPEAAEQAYAVAADVVSVPVLRLMIHEFRLYTSTLRWLTGRWRHGVGEGDIAVRYASGSAGILLAFAYVSLIETVVLAFLIPWPLVRGITLVLDLWGVYFILGLFASFVVRPHVIGADGSLRLRSGALLDIRIPARDIAAIRAERRTARGRRGAVDDDGCADLTQGGQTTVTVELARPVTYTRLLGQPASARVFRFYATDPATAVAALRARAPELQNTP